jgi:hypothetical protein
VRIVRRSRYRGDAHFIVELDDGTRLAVPGWMLDHVACGQLIDEPRARLAVTALRELRALVDTHRLPDAVIVVSADDVSNNPGDRHAISHTQHASASASLAILRNDGDTDRLDQPDGPAAAGLSTGTPSAVGGRHKVRTKCTSGTRKE